MELIHTNRLHVNIQTNFKDASKKYLWCIFFCSYIQHEYRRDYGTISKVLSIIVYNCRYYVAKKNYLCNHI